MRVEGVVLILAGTGLSLVRQAGAGALDTVYAEDGTVFLADAYGRSTLDAISSTYAGYLHVVPRLVAELVSLLPISLAAMALALSAAVITALLALTVFVVSEGVLSSRLARYLVSAVVVLVPVGHDEIPNSIANLHWPALYVLFWLLIGTSSAFRNGLIFFIVLSDVLTIVFLPLAIWRWVRRKEPMPALALIGGLGVQATAIMFGSGGREFTPEPVMWAPWWVIRAVPPGLLGERWFGADVDTRWLVLAVIAWLILAVLLFVGLRFGRKSSAATFLAGLAGAHCVAVYALPVALSGQATPRYAAAPAMLLVTSLAFLLFEQAAPATEPLSQSIAAAGRKSVVWAGRALVALCLIVWALNLRLPNARADGPLWSDQLRQASASCGSADTITIPVSPQGWHVVVPCQAL